MPSELRLADLLGGLSMVADLGFGLPPGTAVRACLVATELARRLDLPDEDVRDCFYAALLMHIGCVAVAHESAAAVGDDLALNRAVARTNLARPEEVTSTLLPTLTSGMAPAMARRARAFAQSPDVDQWARRSDRGVCEVARVTAGRLGLPASTQDALYHVYESWVGGWTPDGLRGDDIAIASRVARAATDAVVFDQLGGPDAAATALRDRAGVLLDPGVVAAFCADPAGILRQSHDGDPHVRMLEVEPAPVQARRDDDLAGLAVAFGDLADVKAPCFHGHARQVAELASGAASQLGLGDVEVRRIELAGLLHDVGRVGVSNALWEKPGPLTRAEWEQARLHAYFTERIMASSPALAPLAAVAGMHHERMDASGYHRGLTAAAIPMGARILAAADAFAAMTQPRPHRRALVADQAAEELVRECEAGGLDPDASRAVLHTAGHAGHTIRERHPAGLSPREAEVLTLMAVGCSNAEVARRLFISRRTAEHHAQHIYAKIGVSTRAAAALFAVQHGLVGPERADG